MLLPVECSILVESAALGFTSWFLCSVPSLGCIRIALRSCGERSIAALVLSCARNFSLAVSSCCLKSSAQFLVRAQHSLCFGEVPSSNPWGSIAGQFLL
ncbi:uncharacterized protein DS421_5g153450 [Arachis hypogaea]|nr:uncharacterized protein DS421_5g153450 [Arachis hypogaea]